MSVTAVASTLTSVASSTAAPAAAKDAAGSPSFGDTLKQLVESVEGSTDQANATVSGMLDKSVDVHDAMIALQRAEMSLQLAVQIRNKLVQAYQDIMRMPV